MKVLIDTNILISAALSSGGTPFLAYAKAVTHPNHAVVCEQNIDELRRVFNRKFPTKLYAMEHFLATALISIEVVPVPEPETDAEQSVRDVADRPILRAAIACGADVLLTGDKDFLESGIEHPKIMTSAEFLAMKGIEVPPSRAALFSFPLRVPVARPDTSQAVPRAAVAEVALGWLRRRVRCGSWRDAGHHALKRAVGESVAHYFTSSSSSGKS